MASDFDYAWRAYRKVRRGFVMAVVGWLGLLLLCVASVKFVTLPEWVNLIVMSAIMPLMIVFSLWHSFWPCPSCRKPFFTTWTMGVPHSKYCLHCGLKKWDVGPIPLERAKSVSDGCAGPRFVVSELELARFIRARRCLLAFQVLSLPIVGAVVLFHDTLFVYRISVPIVAGLSVALFALGILGGDGVCPRCHRPFWHKVFVGRLFTRSCLNCGFDIGHPESTPRSADE